MKKYSKLSWRKNFDQGSNFKVEREYFEILINGKSINQILGSWGNLCGIFGRFGFEHDKQIINQHFLKGKPELDSGRIIISSCNHCGDIGCGALTFKLIIGKDIIWKDFRYEVDHDDDTVNQQYDKKKRFKFEEKEYKKYFKDLIIELKVYYASKDKDSQNNKNKKGNKYLQNIKNKLFSLKNKNLPKK